MKRRNRLALALACIALASVAATFVVWALRNTATYFYSPADLASLASKPRGLIRIGGLVEGGTLSYLGPTEVDFKVTDLKSAVEVRYSGVLPDLFREGQGVVVEGYLEPGGQFDARRVLAKHDATYMPPEVEKALKKRGLWRGPETSARPAAAASAPAQGSS